MEFVENAMFRRMIRRLACLVFESVFVLEFVLVLVLESEPEFEWG